MHPSLSDLSDIVRPNLRAEYHVLLGQYSRLIEMIGMCCLPLHENEAAARVIDHGLAVLGIDRE